MNTRKRTAQGLRTKRIFKNIDIPLNLGSRYDSSTDEAEDFGSDDSVKDPNFDYASAKNLNITPSKKRKIYKNKNDRKRKKPAPIIRAKNKLILEKRATDTEISDTEKNTLNYSLNSPLHLEENNSKTEQIINTMSIKETQSIQIESVKVVNEVQIHSDFSSVTINLKDFLEAEAQELAKRDSENKTDCDCPTNLKGETKKAMKRQEIIKLRH